MKDAGDKAVVAIGPLEDCPDDLQVRGAAAFGDNLVVDVNLTQSEGLSAKQLRTIASAVLMLAVIKTTEAGV